MLFHHNLELCSSSLPFGRIRASSVLLSLNRDLKSIMDIDALCCRFAVELATVEGVDYFYCYSDTFFVIRFSSLFWIHPFCGAKLLNNLVTPIHSILFLMLFIKKSWLMLKYSSLSPISSNSICRLKDKKTTFFFALHFYCSIFAPNNVIY